MLGLQGCKKEPDPSCDSPWNAGVRPWHAACSSSWCAVAETFPPQVRAALFFLFFCLGEARASPQRAWGSRDARDDRQRRELDRRLAPSAVPEPPPSAARISDRIMIKFGRIGSVHSGLLLRRR